MATETKTTDAQAVALVTSYGYTNTTASTKSLLLTKLGLANNYTTASGDTSSSDRTVTVTNNNGKTSKKVETRKTDRGSKTFYTNTTTPLTQDEVLIYKSNQVDELNFEKLNVYNPSVNKVPACVWGVRAEEVLRTTNPERPGWMLDTPNFCAINFGNELSPYVTATYMEQTFLRAASMLYDENGKFVGDQLMRGSTTPNNV